MPKLDKALARELYRLMLRIRLAEERVVALYPTDKIQSPIHLSIGQEAIVAGACKALGKADRAYGTYRGHGLFVAMGGGIDKMMAELYGKDTGCARGKGGSMHMVAPEIGLMGCSAIVASTIPVATGDALAAKMKREKRLTAVFFGDGGIDEGVFYESASFAALKKLPVIYVLENNGYAIHSKVRERHAKTELWRIGERLGLPGRRFDGNDVYEVHESFAKAAAEVKAGKGPILLEYATCRVYEHVGPRTDFKETYHEKNDEAKAKARDPLTVAQKALQKRGWAAPADFAAWRKAALAEIDDAVAFAEKSPFPGPERLLADNFA
ncbi:MAG: thiamine pyrophosphate-dependent dehydrogenase E1 component subunit alpha [Elusimicrobia bacterium]|nr:thiamine pyrophosphate-dependent dehydrogenase E1 component subunit alpha [Elusimicrobiota bacterium]